MPIDKKNLRLALLGITGFIKFNLKEHDWNASFNIWPQANTTKECHKSQKN